MNILDKILETKRSEMAHARSLRPFKDIYAEAMAVARPVRSFSGALLASDSGIIAEFKRRSPSKGFIKEGAEAAKTVEGYCRNGAAAISVLTDRDYFGGSLDDLRAAAGVMSRLGAGGPEGLNGGSEGRSGAAGSEGLNGGPEGHGGPKGRLGAAGPEGHGGPEGRSGAAGPEGLNGGPEGRSGAAGPEGLNGGPEGRSGAAGHREKAGVPLLRKDFIIDPYQICEARIAGADVILLIAAALSVGQTAELAAFAHSMGLEVLLEVHNSGELGHICGDVDVVGVNNRDLATFVTDTDVSGQLAREIPAGLVKISESGISSPETVLKLREAGFRGFLMGENFMKENDPAAALGEFINEVTGGRTDGE